MVVNLDYNGDYRGTTFSIKVCMNKYLEWYKLVLSHRKIRHISFVFFLLDKRQQGEASFWECLLVIYVQRNT